MENFSTSSKPTSNHQDSSASHHPAAGPPAQRNAGDSIHSPASSMGYAVDEEWLDGDSYSHLSLPRGEGNHTRFGSPSDSQNSSFEQPIRHGPGAPRLPVSGFTVPAHSTHSGAFSNTPGPSNRLLETTFSATTPGDSLNPFDALQPHGSTSNSNKPPAQTFTSLAHQAGSSVDEAASGLFAGIPASAEIADPLAPRTGDRNSRSREVPPTRIHHPPTTDHGVVQGRDGRSASHAIGQQSHHPGGAPALHGGAGSVPAQASPVDPLPPPEQNLGRRPRKSPQRASQEDQPRCRCNLGHPSCPPTTSGTRSRTWGDPPCRPSPDYPWHCQRLPQQCPPTSAPSRRS